jgi:hypothetical protein
VLSAVVIPMISRHVYPPGAKHLVPLLDLCIPGLDVNDPMKTLTTSMFISEAISTVKIDDLTRPELQQKSRRGSMISYHEDGHDIEDDGDNADVPVIIEDGDGKTPQLSQAQEDELVRASTAAFPDWVAKFFKAVLAVLDNLPEPGKYGRTGGKTEEAMIAHLSVGLIYLLVWFSGILTLFAVFSTPAIVLLNNCPIIFSTWRLKLSSLMLPSRRVQTLRRELGFSCSPLQNPTPRRLLPSFYLSVSERFGTSWSMALLPFGRPRPPCRSKKTPPYSGTAY